VPQAYEPTTPRDLRLIERLTAASTTYHAHNDRTETALAKWQDLLLTCHTQAGMPILYLASLTGLNRKRIYQHLAAAHTRRRGKEPS
jgi:hypothetical protein